MSVAHCMGRALRIARLPLDQWQEQIESLPDDCDHSDCGSPRSCRKRAAEYLAVQKGCALRRNAPKFKQGRSR